MNIPKVYAKKIEKFEIPENTGRRQRVKKDTISKPDLKEQKLTTPLQQYPCYIYIYSYKSKYISVSGCRAANLVISILSLLKGDTR